MKIKWKLTIALDIMLLSIIVLTTVLIKVKITDLVEDETSNEILNYATMGLSMLDSYYPGDWSVDGETLYKGETVMNDNFELVDQVEADTGLLATIFAGDTRVATTVRDDANNRKTGTQASDEVISKVINQGEPYSGKAVVGGKKAATYYVPLHDKDGKVVGMWFVGIYTKDINEKINHAMLIISTYLVMFLLLGSIAAYLLGNGIANAYSTIKKDLEHLENGEFNVELKGKAMKRKDEVGDIARSFLNMQEKIKNTISSVIASTAQINNSSLKLAEEANSVYLDVENISATTQELSAGMEETAATTEEMSATSMAIEGEIGNVTEKAVRGQQIASEIKDRAENLKSVALESQKTAVEMYDNANKKLRRSIEKAAAINEIKALSKTILDITAQTNLLALNASIESARAGEAGKGFAVVAGEIAILAQNSKNAVSQIENISNDISITVEDIVTDSKELLNFVDTKVIKDYGVLVQTGEQYNDDANTVEQMVTDIKVSAAQLNESIDYIRRAIDEVTSASQEGARGSSDIAEKSTSIFHKTNEVLEQANKNKEIANQLNELLKFFQIS